MAYQNQASMMQINEKLDRILAGMSTLERRVAAIESSSSSQVPQTPPALPPKPKTASTSSAPAQDLIYDEVYEPALPPGIPFRVRGKTFTDNQCDYIKMQMINIKEYVDTTRPISQQSKNKIQESLNSMIATFMCNNQYPQ